MKTLFYKLLYIAAFIITACGGSDDGGDIPQPIAVDPPLSATLVFPNNNSECNEGTVISTTESVVAFRWNSSENTDSYEVHLKNLASGGTTTKTVTTTTENFTIERGAPYEWFIVSKATATTATATSSIWKFYNQGSGIENYAPFPADVISPARGSTIDNTTTVSLKWTGSDVDNDIAEYEVFFGTETTPTTSMGTTTETAMDVSTTSDTIYYWRVLTIDSQNNRSTSEIFEFKVN